MPTHTDAKIIDSWSTNADPWVTAVRSGEIATRVLVTNEAIIEAVRSLSPRTGVDLCCGEGWLIRALPEISMVGVDAIPALIDAARAAGGGDFRLMSYEQIADGLLDLAVDAAVCNFSLIGNESVDGLFRAAPSFLRKGGTLIVQTVHPVSACGEAPYVDGWRTGSWAGLGSGFTDPPPWYFRTVPGWVALFEEHGLRLLEMREPAHPHTGEPVSLILMAELPE
jgi:SAM-dependent methyltransferase